MIYLVNNNKELFEATEYKVCDVEFALDYLNNLEQIQCDTETTGFDPHSKEVICFQLGDKENQFVVPIQYFSKFRTLLESDKVFLFANAKFDLKFFLKYNIIIRNVFDVFLAECVLTTGYKYEETQLGLEDMTLKYCGVRLDKTIRDKIHIEGLTSRVIKYAAEDVTYLEDIKTKQLEKLAELDLLNTIDLENKAVIAFANLEYNGVKIDTNKWLIVAKEVEKLKKEQLDKLDSLVISNPKLKKFVPKYIQSTMSFVEPGRVLKINWGSPIQKLAILKAYGLKIESTGDRELQRNKKGNDLVKELIEFNKFNKLASSFGLSFLDYINPITNRVHCNVWQIISTGRISVKDPNLNQIPAKGSFGKLIRECFIAEEGYSIVGGDYSGMELRIIAEFSNDPLWLKAFDEKQDLHSILCAATFGIDIKDVKTPTPFKPDITYREVQKVINFGLAYGMTEFKLSDTMDTEVKVAKNIINKFFAVVPDVKFFLKGLGDIAKRQGFIRTARPFRRIRWFPEWETAKLNNDFKEMGNIERSGMNMPIQGTNGDIIKYALHLMISRIYDEKLPIKLLLSVYDEIRTECPDDLAEWWKDEMNKIMIEAAQYVLKRVPVELDCKVSKCWEK